MEVGPRSVQYRMYGYVRFVYGYGSFFVDYGVRIRTVLYGCLGLGKLCILVCTDHLSLPYQKDLFEQMNQPGNETPQVPMLSRAARPPQMHADRTVYTWAKTVPRTKDRYPYRTVHPRTRTQHPGTRTRTKAYKAVHPQTPYPYKSVQNRTSSTSTQNPYPYKSVHNRTSSTSLVHTARTRTEAYILQSTVVFQAEIGFCII